MHNTVFTKPEKFDFLNTSHQRGARKGLCTWVSSTYLICNFMPIILERETQHPAHACLLVFGPFGLISHV